MSIEGKKILYGLLRKSEATFKTDMVYAAKGGFWLSFGQIISTGVSFLLAIAFANLISSENFGTYKYILSITAIIGIFSLSGLSSALTRSVSLGREGSFLHSFFLSIRWGCIAIFIAGITAIYYFINENTTLALGILIAGTLSPILDGGELYNAYLNGKKQFKLRSIFAALRSIITGLILFISLISTDNPVILVSIYFISHTVVVLGFFLLTHKFFKPNNERDPELWKLSKHSSFIAAFSTFADSIDNIILFHYFGPVQLAIYNFALAMPSNIIGLLKNVVTLAVPKFATKNFTELKETIIKKSLSLLIFTVPVTIIYITLAPFIFKIFFPQYIDAIIYSQVFALAILMTGSIPIAAFEAHVVIKEKYILNISSNIIKIVILFFGIYWYGIWGAIIGRILSKGLGLAIAYSLIFKSSEKNSQKNTS